MQFKFLSAPFLCSLLAAATLTHGQLTSDWLSGVSPCVRQCAVAAAQVVGCDVYDRACLCRNRAAFLNLVRACVQANCPIIATSLVSSVNPVNLICPIPESKMQFKFISLTLLAAASIASAQVGSIDWLSGLTPCVRQCAIAAATIIGCNVYDRVCLCNNRDAYLDVVRTCIQNNNCPTVSSALNPVNLICLEFPKMQFKSIAFTFLAVASTVSAQGSIDWLAGLNPCVRKCAVSAAELIGCDVYNRICLCSNRNAYLAAVRACIQANCPTIAISLNPVNLICPIIDPIPTLQPL
ncbi:hypothetical protein CVT24_011184 [Panaeolus cyanescens]|uniref:CFEM domain-containing protein n=1 Tax=Panaeolus cyanescens TaxID=181874 RepID=A0A409YG88_9AGAR|nr:hypothetical protein CVT24_011184 [Panaeolus cyanescens]